MTSESKQERNIVTNGGKQAARDVNETNIYNNSSSNKSRIQALLERCEQELTESRGGSDEQKKNHTKIDALLEYDKIGDEDKLDLEEKLALGGRSDRYNKARRYKERFTKKVAKYTFLKSAQHLFVVLLEKVEFEYDYNVKPLINAGEDTEVVDDAVYDHVLKPMIDELTSAQVIISPSEVRGMLYYLTSKCLIDWHTN